VSPVTPEQVAALKARPGEWARVKRYERPSSASSVAGRARKGYYPELAAGEWEAVGRTDGTASLLYLRYLGEQVPDV
jgi:hypothetical protein